MGFKPGNPGKPKGAKNKRTTAFLEVLEDHAFCPASAMIDIYKTSIAKFIEDTQKEESGRISPMESNAAAYLKLAGDMVKTLSAYAYPKPEVKQTIDNNLSGMTPLERIDVMKQALLFLESSQKKDGNGPNAS